MIDRRALALSLAFVAAAGSWWLTRSLTPPLIAPSTKNQHEPDYIIERFDATAMNAHGTRKYDLSAQRLEHFPDTDLAHLTEPRLVQYPEDGAPVITVADAGVIPGDGREIRMRGNVRITRIGDARGPGGTMTTDQLRVELDR